LEFPDGHNQDVDREAGATTNNQIHGLRWRMVLVTIVWCRCLAMRLLGVVSEGYRTRNWGEDMMRGMGGTGLCSVFSR
jgi:hypothetical protein